VVTSTGVKNEILRYFINNRNTKKYIILSFCTNPQYHFTDHPLNIVCEALKYSANKLILWKQSDYGIDGGSGKRKTGFS
jgi:hypothetical protein